MIRVYDGGVCSIDCLWSEVVVDIVFIDVWEDVGVFFCYVYYVGLFVIGEVIGNCD